MIEITFQRGMIAPDNVQRLGIHLGKTIDSTVQATCAQIEPEAIKRRIMATTPPTDGLHRCVRGSTSGTPAYLGAL
jgi:hypothetical protein